MVYNLEIEKARKEDNMTLKNYIWMDGNGQPIPGCISADACRFVLEERENILAEYRAELDAVRDRLEEEVREGYRQAYDADFELEAEEIRKWYAEQYPDLF